MGNITTLHIFCILNLFIRHFRLQPAGGRFSASESHSGPWMSELEKRYPASKLLIKILNAFPHEQFNMQYENVFAITATNKLMIYCSLIADRLNAYMHT